LEPGVKGSGKGVCGRGLKGTGVPKWNTNALWLVAAVCFPCFYIFCLLKCRKCCRPHQKWAWASPTL